MGELGDFLRYLKRDDVREVMLQSGRVAAIRMDEGMHPLTKDQLDSSSIVEMLIRAGLASSLPKKDTRGIPERASLSSGEVDVVIARKGDTLQARFARPGSWTNPDAPRHPAGPDPDQKQRKLQVSKPAAITTGPTSSTSSTPAVAPGPSSVSRPVVTEKSSAGSDSIRIPDVPSGAASNPLPSHPPQARTAAAQTYSMAPHRASSDRLPAALEALLS